ncbi:MAG: ABC transporter ATP-binding protein [Actinomycetota bacterium]
MSIEVTDLDKTYDGFETKIPALQGVDLRVDTGELLVVVGPSGSGKSTLLRTVAGLETSDRGTVRVGDRDVTHVAPGQRDVAMVFQDYALYPHLDIRTNIAFPLLARKIDRTEVDRRVGETAAMLGIGGILGRKPSEVSGGERRRVALARAVVRGPQAFLMDEPLSNLDANLKRRVQLEVAALQDRLGTTTLYVTHDQTEAMMLGHRIAVLREGRVEQVGQPMELYDSPANMFVARFIGRHPMNIFPATAAGLRGAAWVGLRAESLRISARATARLTGKVLAVDRLGAEVVIEAEVAGEGAMIVAERDTRVTAGDDIHLTFSDPDLHLFDEDGEALP